MGVHSWEPVDPLEKTHDRAGVCTGVFVGMALCCMWATQSPPGTSVWLLALMADSSGAAVQGDDIFPPAVALVGIQPCYYGLFVSF